MHPRTITLAVLLCLPSLALAQQGPPSKPIDASQRHATIVALASQLQASYVFPDVAARVATAIQAKDAQGGYAAATDSATFSQALSDDLRTLGKDLHFQVAYDPQFPARPAGPPALRSSEDIERERRLVAGFGFGIDSVKRLPGNVGYLELRGFGPAEIVGEAMSAAMLLLSGTDALILDLRRNGGGEPSGVAYLLSHFFAVGDERHLNDIYSRPANTTRQYWTNASVLPRYTRPVYVLTSKRTFSGGEEAAYDFQTQKRATLVGETTGGGANPGEMYPLAGGFIAFIPDGRSINPVTGTNWEHVGVKPDIAVPAADALQRAHAEVLKTLLAAAQDDEEKAGLREALAKVEAGVVDAPVFTPRRD